MRTKAQQGNDKYAARLKVTGALKAIAEMRLIMLSRQKILQRYEKDIRSKERWAEVDFLQDELLKLEQKLIKEWNDGLV